jgi:3-phosphoshikimate 1-carboxyvinyltransferase
MRLVVSRSGALRGSLRVPSDKSLTHRALMFASIAGGSCRIREPLTGADPLATLECIKALGAHATWVSSSELEIEPAPAWHSPHGELDCGNSGTTMRLLSGLVASRPIEAVLAGDHSLSRRPMGRIATPLRLMGAEIEGEHPPLRIKGVERPKAIDYVSPVASAQVKSAVLLAGLRADGPSSVTEPSLSRDHTERMLRALGVRVGSDGLPGGEHKATVWPCARLEPFAMTVPGDISSAAFLLVAGAIVPGSELELREVGVNPSRTGILDVLAEAGIFVGEVGGKDELGEPAVDLHVKYGGLERPFSISGALVPRLIDEIPVLAVLATQLPGTSVIREAGELRVKETDRVETVAAGLRAMGATVETFEDGLAVTGPVSLRGAHIDANGDHRIGMAFAVAGLIADGQTVIEGADTIATSFPTFETDLRSLQGTLA